VKQLTPRTASGVRFWCTDVNPGCAKNAYPGLMHLHASGVASPEGCMEISPGWSVLCDTRGYRVCVKLHPGRGAGGFAQKVFVPLLRSWFAGLFEPHGSRRGVKLCRLLRKLIQPRSGVTA
jgi:hypothetical protein